MLVNYSLLCLLFIRGSHCIQFFIMCPNLICQMDYSNHNPTYLLNESCISTTLDMDRMYYDFQLSQKLVNEYTYGKPPYSSIELKGPPFRLPVQTINKYSITPYTYRIENFAVDWIHNTTYFVSAYELYSGPIMKTEKVIPLNVVITTNGISSVIGVSYIHFHDGKVDPYRRFLFVFMKVFNAKRFIVIRSDLSKRSVRTIVLKQDSDDYKHYLDVNDQKLYLSLADNIYVYNYEGVMLRKLHLLYPVLDFVVFENNLYMTIPRGSWPMNIRKEEGSNIFELALNQAEPLDIKNTYHIADSNEDCAIQVSDARLKRRKKDGKYLCDRTDCPELCVVESSGDNCVCLHTKAKARDGVMCYDCGQSNLTSFVQEPTIVNGHVSYPSNFPWQAVIYKTNNLEQICGGTLISSQVVLTAAHCVTLTCVACIPSVMKLEELKVAFGKTNRSWNISEPNDVRRNVKKIIVKDGYTGISTNYANDIAVVIMDSKVSINIYVMPACLDYNLNQLPSYDTLTSYVSGFGYTKDCVLPCSNFSNTLLYTTGTPMNLSDCFSAMMNKDHSTFHPLTPDKFCMGDGTASAVQKGDSGGGLTSVYRGLHYLTGVVSVKLMKLDMNDTMKYSFGGFTNVSMHMDWLKQTVTDN